MTGATTQDVTIACDLIADRDVRRAMVQAALDKFRAEQLEHALTARRYDRLLGEFRMMREARDAYRARYTQLREAFQALRDEHRNTTKPTTGRPQASGTEQNGRDNEQSTTHATR